MQPIVTWNAPKIKSKSASYTWTVDYAAIVHDGAYNIDGTVIYPRPWVNRTIEQNDIPQMFQDNLDITRDIDRAFNVTATELKPEFTASIERSDWSYPTTTYRQNGEVVTSPRNIVDTGELRDSLEFNIET